MISVAQVLNQMVAVMETALGVALGSVSRNPYLVIVFASLEGAIAMIYLAFWGLFIQYDAAYEKGDVGENDDDILENENHRTEV